MESNNIGAEKDTIKLKIQLDAVLAATALERIQLGKISAQTT